MKSIDFTEELNGNCLECGTPTILLTTGCTEWAASEEPYTSGEKIEDITDAKLKKYAEDLYEGVELGEEISIHYCPECKKITSICVNWDM